MLADLDGPDQQGEADGGLSPAGQLAQLQAPRPIDITIRPETAVVVITGGCRGETAHRGYVRTYLRYLAVVISSSSLSLHVGLARDMVRVQNTVTKTLQDKLPSCVRRQACMLGQIRGC